MRQRPSYTETVSKSQAYRDHADLVSATLPRTGGSFDPKLRQQMRRLHRLGPRVSAELILELAERCACPGWVASRIEKYTQMDPDLVAALDAGDWSSGDFAVLDRGTSA